jgi:ketosteroid isomerase-like protein
MSTIEELAKRVQELEDIEAIRRLKFEYWDAMDRKDWERWANVFTEDLVFIFPAFEPSPMAKATSRKQFMDQNALLTKEYLKTCHQGHQHSIEITSPTTAKGTWCLRDHLINTKTNTEFKGRAYYYEEYRKVDGKWYISNVLVEYNNAQGSVNNKFGLDITPAFLTIAND